MDRIGGRDEWKGRIEERIEETDGRENRKDG